MKMLNVKSLLTGATASIYLMTSTFAQEQPKQEPKLECVPTWQLPVNIDRNDIMTDLHGNYWTVITNIGTGQQILGFITIKQLFCKVAEGKISPRT